MAFLKSEAELPEKETFPQNSDDPVDRKKYHMYRQDK